MSMIGAGLVSLVGAGPGDPDLLTLKGRRRLQEADIVLHDQLVAPPLLELCGPQCEVVHRRTVGDGRQEALNEFLVHHGLRGKRVVRLKGGDPFVFGRGAEEAQVLADAGVPFEIVPGVSSGIAVPAYAGIPLTHREHASDVTFVTGHEDPKKPETSIQWERIVRTGGTLVVFMGVRRLPAVVETLLEHGADPSTPCAVIHWGTTPRQRTVDTTLGEVVEAVKAAQLDHPALTVIGSVAGCRTSLAWFDRRPLWGRRVLVTRATHQARPLVDGLREFGAGVIGMPVLEFKAPREPERMTRALGRMAEGHYDWLLFTSANTVRHVHEALEAAKLDNRVFGGTRIACIGPATADALREFGIRADVIPKEYRAEGLLRVLPHGSDLNGVKFLLPRAEVARNALPDGLAAAGATVDIVPAYRTVRPERTTESAIQHVELADTVTFTSPSSVKHLLEMMGDGGRERLAARTLAAIGPITSRALLDAGLEPAIVARTYTVDGLVEAIVRHADKVR